MAMAMTPEVLALLNAVQGSPGEPALNYGREVDMTAGAGEAVPLGGGDIAMPAGAVERGPAPTSAAAARALGAAPSVVSPPSPGPAVARVAAGPGVGEQVVGGGMEFVKQAMLGAIPGVGPGTAAARQVAVATDQMREAAPPAAALDVSSQRAPGASSGGQGVGDQWTPPRRVVEAPSAVPPEVAAMAGGSIGMGAGFSVADISPEIADARTGLGMIRAAGAALRKADTKALTAIENDLTSAISAREQAAGVYSAELKKTADVLREAREAGKVVMDKAARDVRFVDTWAAFPGAEAGDVPTVIAHQDELAKTVLSQSEMLEKVREVVGSLQQQTDPGTGAPVVRQAEIRSLEDAMALARESPVLRKKLVGLGEQYTNEAKVAEAKAALSKFARPEDVNPKGWGLALSVIAAGIGGWAAGPGGVNSAVQIMNAGIERKLQAQKEAMRLRRDAAGAARSAYEAIRARVADDFQADNLFRQYELQGLMASLSAAGDKVQDQKVRSDIAQAKAQIQMNLASHQAQYGQSVAGVATSIAGLKLEQGERDMRIRLAAQEAAMKGGGGSEYVERLPGTTVPQGGDKAVAEMSGGLATASVAGRSLVNLGLKRAALMNKIGGGDPGIAERLLASAMSRDAGMLATVASMMEEKDRAAFLEGAEERGLGSFYDPAKLEEIAKENPGKAEYIRMLADTSAAIKTQTVPLMSALGQANGSGVLQPGEVAIWFEALGRQEFPTGTELQRIERALTTLRQTTQMKVRAQGYRLKTEAYDRVGLNPEKWNVSGRWQDSFRSGTPAYLEEDIYR